ncbi:MAG TPA: glycosyltransferase, partial [Solirubrobacteraceae bacterium]|nr:glycosyltransferase [Solirubrobacteraceae bacterium]
LTLRQGAARVAPRPPPPPPASDGRLRILVLSPFPPRLDGAHGGARVIAHMAAELGDRMRVALLCLRHPSEAPVDAALRARVERVEEVARPDLASAGARMARFVRWRLGLLAGRPFWVSDLRQRAYAARLTALVAELRPHVVEIEYPAMAQYLPIVARSGAALVLAEYDPEAGRRERGALLRRLDARAWRLVRRRALRAVDAAIVVTERDRGVLEPLAGPTPLVRIPFGTDFAERSFATGSSDGGLLFVGNFVHPPNVDAARRLVTSIYPAVRERRPDCVLHVVGDGPPADLTSAGVVLTGRVAAVEPYLERAAVVVVPLREGGGMRVKVLEALAAGKAVVASPLAVEGLDVVDGRDLVVAGTDEEFARHVLQLLEDPAARDALGRRARAWAQDNLTWRASVEARGRLYAELLAARRG